MMTIGRPFGKARAAAATAAGAHSAPSTITLAAAVAAATAAAGCTEASTVNGSWPSSRSASSASVLLPEPAGPVSSVTPAARTALTNCCSEARGTATSAAQRRASPGGAASARS